MRVCDIFLGKPATHRLVLLEIVGDDEYEKKLSYDLSDEAQARLRTFLAKIIQEARKS